MIDKKVQILSKTVSSKQQGGVSSSVSGGSSSVVYNNIDLLSLDAIAEPSEHNAFSALRALYEQKKEIENRLIKSEDEKEADDSTFYTSLRTLKEINNSIKNLYDIFLRKDQADSTEHLITFLKGLKIGAKYSINEVGDAVLNNIESSVIDSIQAKFHELESTKLKASEGTIDTLTALTLFVKTLADVEELNVKETATILNAVVKASLSSPKFTSGFLGEGFRLAKTESGDWNLEIDTLTVRKVFQVFELLIQEVKHQGGVVVHSPAGGKITKVTDGGSYWKCEIESADTFFKDDLVLCQKFTGKVKRYWRAVTSAGDGYINLSKTDCEANSAIPEVDDEIVQLGNRTNVARQNAQLISVVGEDAPYIDDYMGINSYSLEDKLLQRSGNLAGIIDKDFGQLKGSGIYSQNAYLKGSFNLRNGKSVETVISETSDKLSGDIGKVNTSVTSVKNELGATISSVENSFNANLNSTKNELNSSINKVQGDADTAKGLAQSAQDSIDGLEIGGRNLLIESKITLNKYLNEDGVISESTLFSLTDYIPVNPSSKYIYSGTTNYGTVPSTCFYDGNKNYISGVRGQSRRIVEAPTTAEYMRVTIYNRDGSKTQKIERGNKPTDWTPAPEDTEAQISKSKEEAEAAAKAYADAQDNLKQIESKAYADGKVTTEEERAIADAKAKLDAAKAYAEAQDAVLKAQQEAYADGIVTEAEQRAINEAQEKVDKAKNELNSSISKVQGDADTAKGLAQSAQDSIDGLEIGGRNIVVNSTGSYNFSGWGGSGSAKIVDDGETIYIEKPSSGGWSFRPSIYTPIIMGDVYTISFYVRGHEDHSRLNFVFEYWGENKNGDGGYYRYDWSSNSINRESFTFLSHTFTASINSTKNEVILAPYGYDIYDIKIEKGNKPTDWTPAPEDIEAQISKSKEEAEAAAKAYADAQDNLKQIESKAYADSKVTEEEKRAIADAKAKLDAAKAYADAKDALLKTQQEAYADGKITAEEQRAIEDAKAKLEAAKKYADAQDKLLKTQQEAYADGKVTEAEKRAIADATNKVNAAKSELNALVSKAQSTADDAKDSIDGLEIGGRNYALKSKGIQNSSVQLYIPDSLKGQEVTLSFRLKLVNAVGGAQNRVGFEGSNRNNLGGKDWYGAWHPLSKTPQNFNGIVKQTFRINSEFTGNYISLNNHRRLAVGDVVELSDVKLEKGNKATDWSPAPEDVQAEIDSAKQDAENASKAYTDIKAEAERIIAEAYADGIVTTEEQARINDVNTKLQLAKEYAEAQDLLLKAQQEAYADGKISQSEQATIDAAKAYADLKKTESDAYADGIVSDEEARAIADALDKFNASKAYADAQDTLLKTQQEAYADGKITASEEKLLQTANDNLAAAKAYAEAQDKALKVKTDAYADGKITAEEQRAIEDAKAKLEAAKKYADAQDALLKTQQEAYADGIVTEAEQRAIDEAQNKVDKAKDELNALIEGVKESVQKEIKDVEQTFLAADGKITSHIKETTQLVTEAQLANGKSIKTLEQVKVQINDINVTAGQINTTLGEVTKKQGEINSSISNLEQTAGSISASIEGFKETEAEIKATANRIEATHEGIVLEASEKSAQKAIDDLEIGGRNLALNTQEQYKEVGSGAANKVVNPPYPVCDFEEYGLVPDDYITITYYWQVRSLTAEPISGDIYLRPSVRELGGAQSYNYFNTTRQSFSNSVTKGMTTISRKIGNAKRIISWMFRLNAPTNVELTLYNVKIEKGNKATDWTPAPEDIEDKIETTRTEFESKLEITKEAITATSTKIDGLTGRVQETEAKLEPDRLWVAVKDNSQKLIDDLDLVNRNYAYVRDTVIYVSNDFPRNKKQYLSLSLWGNFEEFTNVDPFGEIVFGGRFDSPFLDYKYIKKSDNHIVFEGGYVDLSLETDKDLNLYFGWDNPEELITKAKIDLGTKATDWTPAPEELLTPEDIKASIELTTNGLDVFGEHHSFTGKVTFASLASDAQGKINNALSDSSKALSDVREVDGKIINRNYVYQGSSSWYKYTKYFIFLSDLYSKDGVTVTLSLWGDFSNYKNEDPYYDITFFGGYVDYELLGYKYRWISDECVTYEGGTLNLYGLTEKGIGLSLSSKSDATKLKDVKLELGDETISGGKITKTSDKTFFFHLSNDFPRTGSQTVSLSLWGDFSGYQNEEPYDEIMFQGNGDHHLLSYKYKWKSDNHIVYEGGTLDLNGDSDPEILVSLGFNKGTDIEVRAVKLEMGDKATAWIPSPEDTIGLASLDETIIDGGYIKTSLIRAGSITADKIDVDNLIGKKLQTEVDGPRIEAIGSELKVYGYSEHPNIIFGIDKNGYSVLKYLNNDGEEMYNLGPNGIVWGSIKPSSFTKVRFYKLSAYKHKIGLTYYDISAIKDAIDDWATDFYRYFAGSNPTIKPEDREPEKYIYKVPTLTSPRIDDGIYCTPPISIDKNSQYLSPNTDPNELIQPGGSSSLYQFTTGVYNKAPIYVAVIYAYRGGMLAYSQKVYWNGGMHDPIQP